MSKLMAKAISILGCGIVVLATSGILVAQSATPGAPPTWYNQPQFFMFFGSPNDIAPVPFTGQAWGFHGNVYPPVSGYVLPQEVAQWKTQKGVYFASLSLAIVWGSPNPTWDAFRMRTVSGQYYDQSHNWFDRALYSLSSSTYQDFLIALAKQAVDAGADGLQVDDVGSQVTAMLNTPPDKGPTFDAVTMVAFRTYLRQKFSGPELAAQFGIADIATFDFGQHVQTKGLSITWNQQPLTGLSSEFFLFKRQESLSFLRNLVTGTKQYAQQKYGRNFLFSCNDTIDPTGYFVTEVMDLSTPELFYISGPGTDHPFGAIDVKSWLGWKRPTIPLAETAPPGFGLASPLTTQTVNLERVIIADIQAAGGMAGATAQMNSGLGVPEPVDLGVVNRYASFILGNPQLMSQTATPARVGLLHSASSALGGVLSTAGKTNPWNGRGNYAGTAQLLLDSGITYDAVFLPDTTYSQSPSPQSRDLAKYSVVIAPSTFSLDDNQAATLLAYAYQGGTLIVDGDFATNEPDGTLASHPELHSLLAAPGQTVYGAGKVVFTPELFGQEYRAPDSTGQRQARVSFQSFMTPYVQPDVQVIQPPARIHEPGITPFFYRDRSGNALVHLVNYDYDLASDRFYTKTNIQLQVEVGSQAVDEVILRSPDLTGVRNLAFTRAGGTITLTVPEVDAWVVLYFQKNAFAPVINSSSPTASLGAVGGNAVSFGVEASDPDGNPLTYIWSVNGQEVADVFGPAYSLQLPLNANGIYLVMVTVTDGSRVTQTNWTINVAAFRAPRVLFDETHAERNTLNSARAHQLNPQNPTWVLFSILGQALLPNYQVTDFLSGTAGSLTAQALNGVDVLVLAAPDTPLTAAENQAITGFVQSGGGLIFLGDAGLKTSINTLIGPMGIQFDSTTIDSLQRPCVGCFLLSSFANHPAAGLNPSFSTNYGGSLAVTQGAVALGQTSAAEWKSASGTPTKQAADPSGPFVMVGAAQFGSGRVFAVSDNAFHDDYLQASSNPGNLNLLLSGLAWVTSSVNAPPTPPAAAAPVNVTSVNVAGGGTDIGPNSWIEIKGSGLAPADLGGGALTWSSAPEFASGRMPTQLGGVSVKVNGKPAYIYYVSATQVNVLTPLDTATGTVTLQVTNGGTTSPPFSANLKPAAPAFLLFGSTKYVAATHAEGSLLGPGSMSVPGYTFTPAHPGETIVLYGAGFGLPAGSLTEGSASQSGPLATLPAILVGGKAATVTFAGVVSPGLYQLNVVVPSGLAAGDNAVTAAYQGATLPSALIAVQVP